MDRQQGSCMVGGRGHAWWAARVMYGGQQECVYQAAGVMHSRQQWSCIVGSKGHA